MTNSFINVAFDYIRIVNEAGSPVTVAVATFNGVVPTIGGTSSDTEVLYPAVAIVTFNGVAPEIVGQITIIEATVASYTGDGDGYPVVVVESPVAASTFNGVVPVVYGDFLLMPQSIATFSGIAPTIIGHLTVIESPVAASTFNGVVPWLSMGAPLLKSSGVVVYATIATATFSGVAPTVYFLIEPDTATATFNGIAPVAGINEIDYSTTLTLFKCYLNGYELPIKSFQIRTYSTANTYLTVTIPSVDYAAAIAARASGNLSLSMAYSTISTLDVVQENQVMVVTLEDVDVNEGATNLSITLSGHETDAQSAARQSYPKTLTLDNSWFNYIRSTNGVITARMVKPHIELKAGDTVITGSGTFVVDKLTWMKSESIHHMEISEAA